MRILLAEDEKALAKALRKIFEKNNYSVDVVYDGEEASSFLQNGNYDVGILDIRNRATPTQAAPFWRFVRRTVWATNPPNVRISPPLQPKQRSLYRKAKS